jgi:hypothetical protein
MWDPHAVFGLRVPLVSNVEREGLEGNLGALGRAASGTAGRASVLTVDTR